MENKRSLIITLVFSIAVLSLALAVSVGYIFTVAGNPQSKDGMQAFGEWQSRPPDAELERKSLFSEDKIFSLKNDGSSGFHVIKIGAEIQYFKNVIGIRSVTEKVDFYDGLIKELIGTYFQNKTLDDIMADDAKTKAKQELTEQINELLLSSETGTRQIIYTIVFDEWFYQ